MKFWPFDAGEYKVTQILSETDKAYIAGYFDGDGSITITRSGRNDPARKRPRHIISVAFASIDRQSVDFIVEKFGFNMYIYTSRTRRKGDVYHISSHGKRAVAFLREIIPYLRIKKHQAELALSFKFSENPSRISVSDKDYMKREEIAQEIRNLNSHKGVVG